MDNVLVPREKPIIHLSAEYEICVEVYVEVRGVVLADCVNGNSDVEDKREGIAYEEGVLRNSGNINSA